MKSVLAFLAVNAFFVAIAGTFALLFLGVMKAGQALVPDLMESVWFTLPLGVAVLWATIWLACKAHRFIEKRLFQGRGRDLA